MMFSLKNDVVAIEYPIRHFMSESLQNGIFPSWFNTWKMGFPLQSVLSWGIFSTPGMAWSAAGSGIFMLHAEFIFYIITAGWIMFRLLNRQFELNRPIAVLLACCYMLSGFTVGSSQWLLYITGMTFIPLFFHCFLNLSKHPALKSALYFAVSSFLLITNVHVYLTLVTAYIFLSYLLYKLLLQKKKSPTFIWQGKKSSMIGLGFFLAILFCAAPLYYTYELVQFLARSEPIGNDLGFFRSNYLHPEAFKSLLLPPTVIRTSLINTEGSVLNIYCGLTFLFLFPLSLYINRNNRSRGTWLSLIAALVFLLVSFGHLTPVRNWMNFLPGMGHFRHPAVLRVFFIMFMIFYLAKTFRSITPEQITADKAFMKIIHVIFFSLVAILAVVLLLNISVLLNFEPGGLSASLQSISSSQLAAGSAIIQAGLLILLCLTYLKKKNLVPYVLVIDLIINTLVCTPFFSVSSSSASEVNRVLSSVRGFPVQQSDPYEVPSTATDSRGTRWYNLNTFRKEISTSTLLAGPLILKKVDDFLGNDSLSETLNGKGVVFSEMEVPGNSIQLEKMLPGKLVIKTDLNVAQTVTVQQANYPGWRAKYNGKPIVIKRSEQPFISVDVPAGRGEMVIEYRRTLMIWLAIILHLIAVSTFVHWIFSRKKIRWSFPS